jgi:hypothetical protein
MAWTDGTDLTTIEDDDGDPDFFSAGGSPASLRYGTPYVLEGLLRLLDGGARQLVYLPRVTGSAQVLLRRDEIMLGSLEGSVRRETVVGDELGDEVVRVSTITVRESV